MTTLREAFVRQFGKPSGPLGTLASFIMQVRPSNRERNARTLALLDIQPDDHVLELGFGPGVAVKRAAELARGGKVAGIDHSELMLRQATRRNAKAIESGRVDLRLGTAERLPDFGLRFDKVFAVNVYMFWSEPVSVLRGVRAAMEPGGAIALTFQPRRRGATDADTRGGAARMASSLRDAGFAEVRVEILDMAPVSAACVIGRAAE
jgi:cyclopropane fatty-acyl-phospholipid synthase-like methyltransferase